MPRSKNSDIIIDWLKTFPSGGVLVNAEVPLDLKKFGELFYFKNTSVDTYSRLWRKIRNESDLLSRNGLKLIEKGSGKTKIWTLYKSM